MAAPPTPDATIPMWVVQLVGRLTLENELLRRQADTPGGAEAVTSDG